MAEFAGAALLRVSAAEKLAPAWLAMRCGCGEWFTANTRTVPCLAGLPVCKGCWDRLNGLRERAHAMGLVKGGLRPWARPPAYPEDYPNAGG
jgi:hypothetical protein